MTREEFLRNQERALDFFTKAQIVLTAMEKENLEVADFGLGELDTIGLQLVTYVNTEKCCAKEMVLLPGQTCPEHRHAPINGYEGKEETFRCRYGKVYLYTEGLPSDRLMGKIPEVGKDFYTVYHEIVLCPGDQYTIYPNTRHWFQAGEEGAVISEFSTKSYDEYDVFTDPNIVRVSRVMEK